MSEGVKKGDRIETALELLSQGKTYKQIAAGAGFNTEGTARAAVRAALIQSGVNDSERRIARAIDAVLVDGLMRKFHAKAMADESAKSVEVFLKLADHKARLLGLYAPPMENLPDAAGGEPQFQNVARIREIFYGGK